jgi:2-oxoglutarate dehydrogenase E2 component (dihydrolipoamide succinyltransferase)
VVARIDVVMPQMGESIAEGTLSKWLKKVGDAVKRDEPIFEISTDKVDAEIPAPASGTLAEILVTEGQTVPVSTVVARLETEVGAKVAAAAATPAPVDVPTSTSTPTHAPEPAKAAAPSAPAKTASSSSQPKVPAHADARARGQESRAPSGGNGKSLEERLRTKSSPLVRKIAAEHGVEIAGMQGSGIAGRVTKRDIMQYLESGAPPSATRPSMYAPGGVEPHAPTVDPWPGDTVETMSKIRQLTSDHMVQARRHAAHVTSFFEIDLTRVARLRQKMRAQFEQQTGQKLTYLPFVIRVVLDALKQHPVLNAGHSGNRIIYRKQYNIGIAVALDWGLIVPVIRHADDLSLSGLTKAVNDLADRARTKRLKPEEVQNATFTITNPGVFGSLAGTPIIPAGTSAILGLGAIEKRPKVIAGPDGDDVIAVRTCAYFSLSFDHRIVDGADADKFLATVKRGLESYSETEI